MGKNSFSSLIFGFIFLNFFLLVLGDLNPPFLQPTLPPEEEKGETSSKTPEILPTPVPKIVERNSRSYKNARRVSRQYQYPYGSNYGPYQSNHGPMPPMGGGPMPQMNGMNGGPPVGPYGTDYTCDWIMDEYTGEYSYNCRYATD